MKRNISFAIIAMIVITLIASLPLIVHAAGDPSIKISQDPQGTWVIEVSVEGPFTLVVNGNQLAQPSAPAPAQAVAPSGPPASGQTAWGSCLVNGVQRDLLWDSGSRRLFMDPWLGEARSANQASSIPCHIKAVFGSGIVEALGQKIPIAAGGDWFYTFPQNDPSLGFAFKAN